MANVLEEPKLSGHHFRITVVAEDGFVEFHEETAHNNDSDNDIPWDVSGYCIDMLESIAKRANFTYELLPPSGHGSLCLHDQVQEKEKEELGGDLMIPSYDKFYRSQYLCGQSDVNDHSLPASSSSSSSNNNINNDTAVSEYATDMYLSLYYITPERQLMNQFTMAFQPPATGALTMVGIATEIRNMYDLIQQQKTGKQRPVCINTNTAFADFLSRAFPDLQMVPNFLSGGTIPEYFQALQDDICDIHIVDYPIATRFVLQQSLQGTCTIRGKPVGVVGAPLDFGFSQYGIGIRYDMPTEVVNTINYYMNTLMTCSPAECMEDSLASQYPEVGGTGDECGYIAFPPPPVEERILSKAQITGLVVGLTSLLILVLCGYSRWKLRKQKHRFKKRFVQQIARNIAIGPSPGCIPAEKLAEEVALIGGKKGVISKKDLSSWMNDVKLTFLTESDFNALWNAIDLKQKGVVDPIEFFLFLGMCGEEFKEVYHEVQGFSKLEKLKWTARRLTNLQEGGEANVRRIEHSIERRSRMGVHITQSKLPPAKPQKNFSTSSSRPSNLSAIVNVIAQVQDEKANNTNDNNDGTRSSSPTNSTQFINEDQSFVFEHPDDSAGFGLPKKSLFGDSSRALDLPVRHEEENIDDGEELGESESDGQSNVHEDKKVDEATPSINTISQNGNSNRSDGNVENGLSAEWRV